MEQSYLRPTSFRRTSRVLLPALALLCISGIRAIAQEGGGGRRPDRPVPIKPFHMIGNIYYVGQIDNSLPGFDDAAYLIRTSQGLILLDTGEEPTVPQIRENIQKLGFKIQDIKFILNSHAHSDHVAGDAQMKELTGAKLLSMEQDAPVIESGGKEDFNAGRGSYRAAKVDRIIHDGEKIQLGETTMVAHLTAGHTKGCTSWTTVVEDGGKKYNALFLCSDRITPKVPLINNERYPTIAQDFRNTYKTLRSLPVEVFLGSHGNFFGLVGKVKRLEEGASPNPFIDPQAYRDEINSAERDFLAEWKKQGGT